MSVVWHLGEVGTTSSTDIIVTCVTTCSIRDEQVLAQHGDSMQMKIEVRNSQFHTLDVNYDTHTVFRATKTTVLSEKITRKNGEKMFVIGSKSPIRNGDQYAIVFWIKNLNLKEDHSKKLSLLLTTNENKVYGRDLKLEITGGPLICGPLKSRYTVAEGSDDEVQFLLCANPPPSNVWGKLGENSNTGNRVESKSNMVVGKYFYVINLYGMKRWQCGYGLTITATGYEVCISLIFHLAYHLYFLFAPSTTVAFPYQFN